MITSTETEIFELYFWPTPNGYKVSILLEELEVPYRLIPVNISAGDQHAPDFIDRFANEKIPGLIHHHSAESLPRTIFESGAILLYLADWFGRFLPESVENRWRCLQWLFWQVGGLGPMAGQSHHFNQYATEKIAYAIDRYQRECLKHYQILERQLQKTSFLAGDYSIADIAVLGWVFRHERHRVVLEHFPAVEAWYAGLMNREAVKRGFETGADLIPLGNFNTTEAREKLF